MTTATPAPTTPTVPTTLVRSPGRYYHQHIKPGIESGHYTLLEPIHTGILPPTSKLVTRSSWIVALDYCRADANGTKALLVWTKASKAMQSQGYRYRAIRIVGVEPHHVGALMAGFGKRITVNREPTDDELIATLKTSLV